MAVTKSKKSIETNSAPLVLLGIYFYITK